MGEDMRTRHRIHSVRVSLLRPARASHLGFNHTWIFIIRNRETNEPTRNLRLTSYTEP
ncbi:hypothetical protein J6590_039223 [Homalodisca vitripennis]|nr:hypothetical protein J6590_039223 [Homalodisca vitripennis]